MSTEDETTEPVAGSTSDVTGSTPGVQAHMPGEDDTDSSIGGTMPDGDAIDHVADDELPGVDGASSGGDSVADDDAGDAASRGDDGADAMHDGYTNIDGADQGNLE